MPDPIDMASAIAVASTYLRVSMPTFPNPLPPTGDVMQAQCRARAVLTVLAERWALLVIEALSDGPVRTGDLRRRIEGVSEKMLIQTLRRLQSLGLVERRDHHEVPPRVDYALSARGLSLSPLVLALDRWVEAHAFAMMPAGERPADRLDDGVVAPARASRTAGASPRPSEPER